MRRYLLTLLTDGTRPVINYGKTRYSHFCLYIGPSTSSPAVSSRLLPVDVPLRPSTTKTRLLVYLPGCRFGGTVENRLVVTLKEDVNRAAYPN